MADDSVRLLGPQGRHRSPGAVVRVAAIMKHLSALPANLRFFAEPFENWIAGACMFSGILAVLGQARPLSLAVQMPPWLLHAWGATMAIGGVATLIARWRIARPQTDLGDRSARALEELGLAILATAISIYAIAILAVGASGLPAGSITAAMAGACGMRAWIVARELKAQRSASDV